MAKKFKIKLMIFLASIILFTASFPWLLYEIGLSNIEGRPTFAVNRAIDKKEIQQLWQDMRETEPIQIKKLNPWQYVLFLVQGVERIPSMSVTSSVARDYNHLHLKNRKMLYWHLSGAASSIWLTRNWSMQDILAKAKEIKTRKMSRLPDERE